MDKDFLMLVKDWKQAFKKHLRSLSLKKDVARLDLLCPVLSSLVLFVIEFNDNELKQAELALKQALSE